MSFLGKVLIVAQVVLSLLFMCAAGAVYTAHTNWHEASVKKDADIAKLTTDRTNEVTALNQQLDARAQELTAEKNRADAVVGRAQQLEGDVARLNQETNSLNQQLQRANGLAATKSNEAEFRQSEAERERVQNETLRTSLDEQIRKTVTLEDELGTRNQAYEELVAQHAAVQDELEFVSRIARQANLNTDRQSVEMQVEPPLPVEGLVQEVRKDQTNRTKWVHVSVGSDDGLRVGHEMDVYRTAERNDGRAKYLGRIRIWSVEPDQAVGLVVEAAKNGIIEVGDNVTTKL
ncbi:MAG: hypothetical protein JNG89_19070 [Planctomycetaceae bacterium]|nr:hypothetical protein [Planctomycetaceae bacterium]